MHTIAEGSRCGLIDDAQDIQPCNAPSILGGLPLCIIKVCWYRNDCLLCRPVEIPLSRLLHLLQYEGSCLRGRERFPPSRHPRIPILSLDNLEWNHLYGRQP
jgi:hypothetical protein